MFEIEKKSAEIYKKIKKDRVIGALLLLTDEFTVIFPAYFLGLAIDEFKTGTLTPESVVAWSLKILAVTLLSYLLSTSFVFFMHNSGNKVGYLFRRKIFSSILNKAPQFFNKFSSGDILARATNDTAMVDDYFGFGLIMLMDSFIYPIVCILSASILISWKLTLAVVIPVPLITMLYVFTGKKIQELSSKTFESFGSVNQEILEIAEGIKLVRCFVNEQVRLKKLSKTAKTYFSVLYAKIKIENLLGPVTKIITYMSALIAFCYGGYLVHIGELTSGNLVTFFIFVNLFSWSAMASCFYMQVYKVASASIERINEIFKTDFSIKQTEEENSKLEKIEIIESLEFKNLSFNYDENKNNSTAKVLEDISFKINNGETLGISGKTGSGKSTLIKQIFCLYPEVKGVLINGIESEKIDLKSIRKKIGYVSQTPQLISGSIYDNICFFRKGMDLKKVEDAVKLADLQDFVDSLKDGLQTQIGEKGVNLSGGQRQRISLARAILSSPDVLILDDAVSALDADTEARILHNLKENNLFKICIICSHRISAIKDADEIIVLDEGKITQRGNHQDLLEEGGWYAEQFEYQHSHSDEDVNLDSVLEEEYEN